MAGVKPAARPANNAARKIAIMEHDTNKGFVIMAWWSFALLLCRNTAYFRNDAVVAEKVSSASRLADKISNFKFVALSAASSSEKIPQRYKTRSALASFSKRENARSFTLSRQQLSSFTRERGGVMKRSSARLEWRPYVPFLFSYLLD